MHSSELFAVLDKGDQLTAEDVRGLEVAVALLPLDEAHELEPLLWEGVGLIVNDPAYNGDARLPDRA